MKKTIILAFALAMLMTACGDKSDSSSEAKADNGELKSPSISVSEKEEESETETTTTTTAKQENVSEDSSSKKEETEKKSSDTEKSGEKSEVSDNFLDIIPLADPANQVGSDGVINDVTIADSLEEGIQAFENLDAYSKVVRVDDKSNYDSLKQECDDKALIAVTFDVDELLDYETEDYYYDVTVNDINYHLVLGNSNSTRWDIVYTYLAQGDKDTTVIGKAKFKGTNTIELTPYAVNIGQMYVPDKESKPTSYVVAFTPTFAEDYEFDFTTGGSIYYIIREGELFQLDWSMN